MSNNLLGRPEKATRLFYIDHLRVTLVILVLLHHVAAVYGAAVPFYYVEPPFTDAKAFQILLVFMLANQGFFMGVLFFLAGYVTPGSFDRKGPVSFLKERVFRLGIPLILFLFVLNPVSSIGYYLMPEFITGITTPLTWQEYPKLIGLGPLWFVAMLLLFGFGYAAWRLLTRNRTSRPTSRFERIGYIGILLFVVGLAAVSYLMRMIIPLGKSILDFPTLAYLPQYLSFFTLGIVAYRRSWLDTLTTSKGIVGFAAALAAGVILFPLAFGGRFFSLTVTSELGNAMGNGHWQSAIYALWDSIFAVGMCLGLIILFRRFFNGRRKIGSFLSRHSYSVYIIHTPIIVMVAYLLRGMDLSNLAKFGVAAVIMIPACFAAAFLVRKIPSASRIL
jgi:glucans biosynthesis protein C